MKLSMKGTQSAGKSDITMDLHAANAGELKLTLDVTQEITGDKPAAEPPEGANVVDAAELLEP